MGIVCGFPYTPGYNVRMICFVMLTPSGDVTSGLLMTSYRFGLFFCFNLTSNNSPHLGVVKRKTIFGRFVINNCNCYGKNKLELVSCDTALGHLPVPTTEDRWTVISNGPVRRT